MMSQAQLWHRNFNRRTAPVARRRSRGVHWIVALALSSAVSLGVTAPWAIRAIDARVPAVVAALAAP